MKTGEIYTYALGDPMAKFKSVGETLLGCSDLVVRFNHVGKLVDDENGSLVYPRFDMEWELVREPVDFMTAVNSGKNVRSEYWKPDDHLKTDIPIDEWLRVSIKEINGKWYIIK